MGLRGVYSLGDVSGLEGRGHFSAMPNSGF